MYRNISLSVFIWACTSTVLWCEEDPLLSSDLPEAVQKVSTGQVAESAKKAQDILSRKQVDLGQAPEEIAAALRDSPIFKDIERFVERMRKRFLAFKTFPHHLAQALKLSSFNAQEIRITTQYDDGIVIDFGYPGVGDATKPYSGFNTRITVGEAPKEVQQVITKSLEATPLKEIVHGDPRVEFALKLALLLKGRFDKTIPQNEFIAQLHLVLYKMFNTPKFDSVRRVVDSVPPFVRLLLNALKIKGKSVVDYVDQYYQTVGRLARFQFPRKYDNGSLVNNPRYRSYGKLSDAQAQFVLMALCQKVLVYYTQMRAQFLQTSPGQTAFEEYKRQLANANATQKIKVHATFVNKIPKFRSLIIERFLVGEVARVFANLTNPAYKNTVGTVLNPLLSLIGLNFDDVLSLYDNSPQLPPVPPAQETVSVEGDIDFNAEFSNFDDSAIGDLAADDWGSDISWDDTDAGSGSTPPDQPVGNMPSKEVEDW